MYVDLTTPEGLLEFTGGAKPVCAAAVFDSSELLTDRRGGTFATPTLDRWYVHLYDQHDECIGELGGFSVVEYSRNLPYDYDRAAPLRAAQREPAPCYRRDRTLTSESGRTVSIRSWLAHPEQRIRRDVDPALIPNSAEIFTEMLDYAALNLLADARAREEWARQHRINAGSRGIDAGWCARWRAEAAACEATAADLRSAVS